MTSEISSPGAVPVAPEYGDSFGYSLAMRVLQSSLYSRLDGLERAECDELIRRGMTAAAPSHPPASAVMGEVRMLEPTEVWDEWNKAAADAPLSTMEELRCHIATALLKKYESVNAGKTIPAAQQSDSGSVHLVAGASSEAVPGVTLDAFLTDAYADGRRDEREELASVLPGTTYMDPPDGGAPTILEQLQRQAKDAARFHWLVADHADGATRAYCRALIDRLPVMSYSAACVDIDAAMKEGANK